MRHSGSQASVGRVLQLYQRAGLRLRFLLLQTLLRRQPQLSDDGKAARHLSRRLAPMSAGWRASWNERRARSAPSPLELSKFYTVLLLL